MPGEGDDTLQVRPRVASLEVEENPCQYRRSRVGSLTQSRATNGQAETRACKTMVCLSSSVFGSERCATARRPMSEPPQRPRCRRGALRGVVAQLPLHERQERLSCRVRIVDEDHVVAGDIDHGPVWVGAHALGDAREIVLRRWSLVFGEVDEDVGQ